MNKVRCAIYTRKSSEEGLEQDFNSLHAQREACAAYILSQASEGWSLLPDEYDDGGLSGGTLERPALQRLLEDISAGKIDIVVVYKVDRLTRSLLDFAKLVETMDKAEVSFVSVTQSFNTTNSMGRLTLNMLLSFAQFEREVTAERIRDKIAASKAKGMWMGGNPPLGYEPEGRTLAIVEDHAALIRGIYRRYLEIGNVRLLKQQLDDEGLLVPERFTSTGRRMGGVHFTRGQIYKILSNPIYTGRIEHKGEVYDGQHDAIIDDELWDAVQTKMEENRQGKQAGATTASPSLLAGKVFDESGGPLVASHACKGKVRYRYYVSRALQNDGANTNGGLRIPAREIEAAVTTKLAEAFSDPLTLLASLQVPLERALIETARAHTDNLLPRIKRREQQLMARLIGSVTVLQDELRVHLDGKEIGDALGIGDQSATTEEIVLTSPVRLNRSGMAMRLVEPGGTGTVEKVDQPLVDLLVQARKWWARLEDGETTIAELARQEGINDSWISRVVRLNFLAPSIVTAILEGRQPVQLDATSLTTGGVIPAAWDEQSRALGIN